MQIYTPEGEIDTKDIEFIAIKKTESDCLEYAIFARVEGKDYELEYTKTNDFKKICSKLRAISDIIKNNSSEEFVRVGNYLVNSAKLPDYINKEVDEKSI